MAKYKEINRVMRGVSVAREWLRRGFSSDFFLYRLKWNHVARYDHVTRFPLHLDIEVTEACNLKCIMCVHGTTGVPVTGRIDMDFAKNMVDQAAEGGARSIKFNWRGEPALHTGLEELVAYAKAKGILEVQINTNGIPYTKDRINDLIDAGLDRVIFSMDGATKETYESIRVGADFDRLMSNIRTFHELREAKGRRKPFIRIQMVRMKDNQDEVNKFIEMWQGIADDIAIKDVTNRGQGGHLSVGDQITAGRRRCPQPWQRMVVARDGKVFPCCSDWDRSYEIGDANDTALAEIWKGERMETLRDINRQKRLNETDPCRNCFVVASYEWRKLSPEEVAVRDRKPRETDQADGSPGAVAEIHVCGTD